MSDVNNDAGLYEVKIATLDEFRRNSESWNALAEAMDYPSIFCTWEWINTWWQHFGNEYRPLILFIYRNGELTGILPLYLEKSKNNFPSGTRLLGFCGSTKLYPDHLDIICAAGNATPCLDAAFKFLLKDIKCWDVLKLPFLAENSNLFSWLSDECSPVTWLEQNRTVAPYLELSGSFEDYIGSFKSSKRHNILSRRRKLVERHGMQYTGCDGMDITECLDKLYKLHKQRAGAKGIESTFGDDEIFRFHSDFLKAVENRGWAWLRFLQAGDSIIAAFYGFSFGKHVFYYQMGHDPEWRTLAPGKVIIYETLQEAFTGGYHEYNFLQGAERYKYDWTGSERVLHTVSVYRNRLRGRLANTKAGIKKTLRRLPGFSGHERET